MADQLPDDMQQAMSQAHEVRVLRKAECYAAPIMSSQIDVFLTDRNFDTCTDFHHRAVKKFTSYLPADKCQISLSSSNRQVLQMGISIAGPSGDSDHRMSNTFVHGYTNFLADQRSQSGRGYDTTRTSRSGIEVRGKRRQGQSQSGRTQKAEHW